MSRNIGEADVGGGEAQLRENVAEVQKIEHVAEDLGGHENLGHHHQAMTGLERDVIADGAQGHLNHHDAAGEIEALKAIERGEEQVEHDAEAPTDAGDEDEGGELLLILRPDVKEAMGVDGQDGGERPDDEGDQGKIEDRGVDQLVDFLVIFDGEKAGAEVANGGVEAEVEIPEVVQDGEDLVPDSVVFGTQALDEETDNDDGLEETGDNACPGPQNIDEKPFPSLMICLNFGGRLRHRFNNRTLSGSDCR